MADPVSIPSSGPEGFSVDLMSDIHVDKWNGAAFDYAAHKKSDIAVIAGDVADGSAVTLEELKKIAAVYKTVLFVDGNHEFYSTRAGGRKYNFDFAVIEKELHDGIAKIPNVVYLRDRPFVKDGIAIIGRNGHWDYKIARGITEKEAVDDAAAMFKSTFNEAASFAKSARDDYDALRKQVKAFDKDPGIHTIVVVTHTVPLRELLTASGKISSAWQSRAGSGLMRRLQKYDTHKKIKFWLFGHSHKPIEREIDGILYRQNPRGGSNEGRTDYKPAVVAL